MRKNVEKIGRSDLSSSLRENLLISFKSSIPWTNKDKLENLPSKYGNGRFITTKTVRNFQTNKPKQLHHCAKNKSLINRVVRSECAIFFEAAHCQKFHIRAYFFDLGGQTGNINRIGEWRMSLLTLERNEWPSGHDSSVINESREPTHFPTRHATGPCTARLCRILRYRICYKQHKASASGNVACFQFY